MFWTSTADLRESLVMNFDSGSPELDHISASGGSIASAIMWGVPVALLAAIFQGLVAIKFDVGLLYPVIGCLVGSVVRVRSPRLGIIYRQIWGVALTYFAIALSPLIPFGRAIAFDPIRMRNTAIGLVVSFIPTNGKPWNRRPSKRRPDAFRSPFGVDLEPP